MISPYSFLIPGIFLDSALDPNYTKFAVNYKGCIIPNFSCLKYLIITWQ